MKNPSGEITSKLAEENSFLKQRVKELERSESDHRRNEEYLGLALQRLHSHIENSPLAVVEFDADFRVIYWSRLAEHIFGWTAEEILGKHINQIKWVHEEDAERVANLFLDMLKGSCPSNVHTNRNYRKDGSVITCEWYNSALLSPEGELVSVLSRVLDITERKRVEEALKESDRLLCYVTDNLPNAMLYQLVALPGGGRRFIYLSRGVERLNETSVEEALADANVIYGQVLPEFLGMVREREEEALKNLTTMHVEVRSRLPGGRFRWFEYTSTPRRQSDGVLVWDGIEVDVTERKHTEEALALSEERFRAFMDNSPAIAWAKDEQGRYVYLSRAYETRLGVRLDDYLGKTDYELWPLDVAKLFRKNDRTVLNSGRTIQLEEGTSNPDGSRNIWWTFKFPFWDSAGRRYVGGMGVDITDRKKMEEELRIHRDHLNKLVAERTAEITQEVGRRKEREEQYLALVESIKGWVWETDANLVHTYASSGITDIAGYKPEEFIGKNPTDFVPVEELQRLRPLIERTVSQKESFISLQHAAFHKNGQLIFVEVNGAPFFDKNGELLGYRGSCHDITEHRKIVDELREREQDLTAQSKTLLEVNTALKVLLRQIEEDRKGLEERFVSNAKNLVTPYIEKLKRGRMDPQQHSLLEILEANLNEIVSPLVHHLQHLNLTPRETQVANLIRDGKTTKEMAEIIGVAPSTIGSCRNSIRNKLKLTNQKTNLRSYLQTLS
jgi:PAS domain S-box-containing protein